jgi:sulfofructose kinase
MTKEIDLLGLGYAAVDDLLYVDGHPEPDAKMQVQRRERQCGGLTATALVAAARMGCRCAYAGTLGDDSLSAFVLDRLRAEGIDVSHVRRQPEARPVTSTILVNPARHSRTILYDLNGVVAADPSWPPEDVILASRALLVDHCGIDGMIRAAEIARHAGIPVIADLERGAHPRFSELFDIVDHLILSRGFALEVAGENDPAAAAKRLWTSTRRVVAITCGREGCWFVSEERPGVPRHQPALAVETVDTTGCGDVFHGAYAAALVQGADIPTALRFASVAAGLKAKCPGGQGGIPTRAAVEEHMSEVLGNENA